jgi:hypothetical protein
VGLDEESLMSKEKLADEGIKIKETVDKDSLSKQEQYKCYQSTISK